MPAPDPADLVALIDRYTDELYHRRNLDALADLIADPLIRYEPEGQVLSLTLDESRARIAGSYEHYPKMIFTTRKLVADESSVAMAYEAVLTDADGAEVRFCGVEIFVVREGRIAEVWNPPAGEGRWG